MTTRDELAAMAEKAMHARLAGDGDVRDLAAATVDALRVLELVEALRGLTEQHYDEDGLIDHRSGAVVAGRAADGSLVLKGSQIARLERARALLVHFDGTGKAKP